MTSTTTFLIAAFVSFAPMQPASGEPNPAALDKQFRDVVKPFLEANCLECHNAEKSKGDLDLSGYQTSAAVGRDFRRWDLVIGQLDAKSMPPEKYKHQPTAEERKTIISWIRATRREEAKRTAGDPGLVPARRLSNAEFDNTIRDLTGVDLRPTKEFPVDPANEQGFDNSAESLTMSPALVKKYLQAARTVTNHLVLKPDGFAFAEYPVLADTDRDKYCVREVINFYKRQNTDYAEYFFAAWQLRYWKQLDHRFDTPDIISRRLGISAKYLKTILNMLQSKDEVGPIAAIKAEWNALPVATKENEKEVHKRCEALRDAVVKLRKQVTPIVKNLPAPGIAEGSQPVVLWKNREQSANRMAYRGGALTIKTEGLFQSPAAQKAITVPGEKSEPDDVKKYEATFNTFCKLFPDAFLVSERARAFIDPEKEKSNAGRLLNAGFHSMTGYYRDDEPFYQLVLEEEGQKQLDRLWREFDFVTNAPVRQYTSFIWFEHAESGFIREPAFDGFRAEDKDVSSEAKIKQMAKLYLAKVNKGKVSDTVVKAVEDHFRIASDNIRRVEADRIAAEPLHLKALQTFAEKAYRRTLTDSERKGIIAFYQTLRKEDGLTHDDAVRDSIVAILMSPHFCFRTPVPQPGTGNQPLADGELANRLSYFLWASMPDAELLARVNSGELRNPAVLLAQVKRMLKDERTRGLATEFAGNWLDIRRFEEHNSVDRARFPTFNNDLRQAMFEEPIHFFLDVVHSDRSILDFLYADDTFVNKPLAKHYGMPEPKGSEWIHVEHADKFGRGGLIPMAVFLTKNSPGLRTSPVKRGYWVVRKLLGEVIPPPPPLVGELPTDESKIERPLREILALHRAERSCAMCHNRFDGVGLTFEGFGPVGERRTKDLGNKPIDAKGLFPDGTEGTGVAGLKKYIREKRQDEFVDNFCRKMLTYALGRSPIPGDDLLIDAMKEKLAKGDYRLHHVIDTIVTSPQFLNRRNADATAKGSTP